MKKLHIVFTTLALLAGAMLFLSLRAADNDSSSDSSQVIEKSFEVGPFTSISASFSFQVFYTPSDERSVIIEAPANAMPNVQVSVDRSGTLVLTYKDKDKKRKGAPLFSRNTMVKAYVTGPDVSGFTSTLSAKISCAEPISVDKSLKVTATTSGQVRLVGVKCPDATLEASTSGSVEMDSLITVTSDCSSATSAEINIGTLKSDNVKMGATTSGDVHSDMLCAKIVKASVSTSGTVAISRGTASYLNVAVTTSGDFKGSRFLVENADASATTSGDVRLNARSLSSSSSLGGKVKNSFKN